MKEAALRAASTQGGGASRRPPCVDSFMGECVAVAVAEAVAVAVAEADQSIHDQSIRDQSIHDDVSFWLGFRCCLRSLTV